MVNYPAVPHAWVLVYCVNQRSHVTKITEVKTKSHAIHWREISSQLHQHRDWLLYLGHQNTLPT